MIEEQLLSVLLDDSAGYPTIAEDRVFALRLPEFTAYPAITFQRVASAPVNSVSGSSGLDYVRVQVDCWAEKYEEAKRTAEDVRRLLGAASFKALLATDRDEYDNEARVFRVINDFLMWQK